MKILRRDYKIHELYILKKSILKILLNPRKIINLFLVKISIFLKMRRCLGLPVNIFIEPTVDCNYDCIKCEKLSNSYPYDNPVTLNTDTGMPFENYKKIIDDIGETLLTLRLWHHGEPLLKNDIFQMVEYAKLKNIIVALSSNLSLLTQAKAQDLVRSGLDYLIVSCDGASKDTYNFYHGRDYFNQIIENIRNLIQIKTRLKSKLPFIDLQFIVMKDNENEIDKINILAKYLGVDKLSYIKLDTNRIDTNKFRNINPILDIHPRNKNFCLNLKEIRRIKFCSIPWEEALIRFSGVVLPCCTDNFHKNQIGELFIGSEYVGFKELWNNKNLMDFRENICRDIDGINICFSCAKRNNSADDQIRSVQLVHEKKSL